MDHTCGDWLRSCCRRTSSSRHVPAGRQGGSGLDSMLVGHDPGQDDSRHGLCHVQQKNDDGRRAANGSQHVGHPCAAAAEVPDIDPAALKTVN